MGSSSGSHLFKKGQSGNPGGKKKGTKNKVKFDFLQTCCDEGFNPCLELIKIVRNTKSDHVRVTACSEIASYVAPKLKAIEISVDEAVERFQLNFNVISPDQAEKKAEDDRLLRDEDGK